jgi:hypothetical protein
MKSCIGKPDRYNNRICEMLTLIDTVDIILSFNNFQRPEVRTILIGLNIFKNLLHFVMKKKKSFVGHLLSIIFFIFFSV